jgi:hypothetical protein
MRQIDAILPRASGIIDPNVGVYDEPELPRHNCGPRIELMIKGGSGREDPGHQTMNRMKNNGNALPND